MVHYYERATQGADKEDMRIGFRLLLNFTILVGISPHSEGITGNISFFERWRSRLGGGYLIQ